MSKGICAIRNGDGFTLVELLLVIVIAGAILVVVVPRAYRANIDSKYTLLRQTCSELASNANKWAEQQVDLQPAAIGSNNVTAEIRDYLDSLSGVTSQNPVWVSTAGNWVGQATSPAVATINIANRQGTPPTQSVYAMFPPGNQPRNPFNGASVFVVTNNPDSMGGAVPGAVACGWDDEAVTGLRYYALIFQGTDNENSSGFHAGQGSDIDGLRNGVFITRK